MHTRNIYIILLVIIFSILFYTNYYTIFPIFEGVVDTTENTLYSTLKNVSPATEMTETQATIDNKQISSDTTTNTVYSKLSDVSSKIQVCQTMIDNINAVLPRRIEDIQIGTINQTDDVNQVSVRVLPSTTTMIDPITQKNSRTGIWTIQMILPKGKQGPTGTQGLKGKTGPIGKTGTPGEKGLQGPWGNNT